MNDGVPGALRHRGGVPRVSVRLALPEGFVCPRLSRSRQKAVLTSGSHPDQDPDPWVRRVVSRERRRCESLGGGLVNLPTMPARPAQGSITRRPRPDDGTMAASPGAAPRRQRPAENPQPAPADPQPAPADPPPPEDPQPAPALMNHRVEPQRVVRRGLVRPACRLRRPGTPEAVPSRKVAGGAA